jgi:protein-tyrosine phosphatase
MVSLDWAGCYNVRDLGGLPTRDGGSTRRAAVVRARMSGG